MYMFDVIAIGSATRDNFLKGKYPLVDSKESPSGKAYLLPYGEKLGVDYFYSTIGGNAANASVTFARHGFKTACAAKIGEDLAAKELLVRLKKDGVNTKLIAQTKEKPTAYSVLLLSETGERTILGYHGASDTFKLEDLKLSSEGGSASGGKKLKAKWWYLSLAGESDEMYLPLLKFAKENSIKVAFNPSGHHLKHKRQEVLDSLKDIAFLVLNKGEAAELVGISFSAEGGPASGWESTAFKKLDELTPGIVAVTDGPNGVTVSDGKNLYKAGIFKERQVADRTGAGDSFGSGFVARLALNPMPHTPDAIQDAIRFASANATSVVEQIGATEGILTKKEFETDPRWKNFNIQIQSF